MLHDIFMKNVFLRALICPFTNGQICKRKNNLPIDKCQRTTNWLDSSVGRVLARLARGPGFESRSGHDFFLLCDTNNLSFCQFSTPV